LRQETLDYMHDKDQWRRLYVSLLGILPDVDDDDVHFSENLFSLHLVGETTRSQRCTSK